MTNYFVRNYWKKVFCITIGLIVVCILSLITLKVKENDIYPLFSEQEYVSNMEGEIVAINDVLSDDTGYKICGEDAYVVYRTNIQSSRGIRIQFKDVFKEMGIVQIFYAGDGEAFSEERAVTVTVTADEDVVDVPVNLVNVSSVRVDVNADDGTVFEIVNIQLDSRIISFKDIVNKYTIAYLILFMFACFIYEANRKWNFIKNDKISSVLYIVFGWGIVAFFVYFYVFYGVYDITTTNLMYASSPWSSNGIQTSGPLLSDPVDSMLPALYDAYYGEGFSFWNNKVAFGVPTGVEVIINPFNWFYLFPIKYAILLKSIFEYSVAYFGMCYLLSRLKLCTSAQMIGGISYALSSAMVMWHFWPHTDVMMLAPIILALGNKLIEERKIKDMFFMSLIIFLMLIAEMPTYAAYVIYLLGFYILFMTIIQYKKEIKKIIRVFVMFAGAIILGVITAFPYLLFMLNTVVENGYADSRRGKASSILSVEYLRTIFLPYFRENLTNHINESTIYVGIAVLLFLLFAGVRWKQKKQNFWFFSFIVVILLVFTTILNFIYVQMPGINSSNKCRLISIVAMLAVVIGAISYNDIVKNIDEYKKKHLQRVLIYIVFILLEGVILYLYKDKTEWAICSFAGSIFLIIALEYIISSKKKYFIRGAKAMILGIVIVNMGIFAREYFPTVENNANIIPEATDSIEYLQGEIGEARIYAVGGWNYFPNTNVFYGINSITSHSFVNTNEDIRNYCTSIDDSMAITKTAFHGVKVDNYNLLQYAGVKYIVKSAQDSDNEITGAELVYSGMDGVDIYELDDFNSRFFLSEAVFGLDSEAKILENMEENYEKNSVHVLNDDIIESDFGCTELQENENIEVIDDHTDYIVIKVASNEKRILVFNEYNNGNWRVIVDGGEAEIIKVNYLFNGILIDAGEHTVEFIYDVDRIMVSCIIACCSMAVIISGVVITMIMDLKKRKGSRTNETNNSNTLLQ